MDAIKMLRIKVQRAEEFFAALMEISENFCRINLADSVAMAALFSLWYISYIKTISTWLFAVVFLVTATYFVHGNIPLPKIMSTEIS